MASDIEKHLRLAVQVPPLFTSQNLLLPPRALGQWLEVHPVVQPLESRLVFAVTWYWHFRLKKTRRHRKTVKNMALDRVSIRICIVFGFCGRLDLCPISTVLETAVLRMGRPGLLMSASQHRQGIKELKDEDSRHTTHRSTEMLYRSSLRQSQYSIAQRTQAGDKGRIAV